LLLISCKHEKKTITNHRIGDISQYLRSLRISNVAAVAQQGGGLATLGGTF